MTEGQTEPLLTVVIIVLIYFIPAINAHRRDHHQKGAITLLNIFLGWTLIGWVIAVVWSQMPVEKKALPDAPKDAETKECTQCAETIKLKALVCHFCGHVYTD